MKLSLPANVRFSKSTTNQEPPLYKSVKQMLEETNERRRMPEPSTFKRPKVLKTVEVSDEILKEEYDYERKMVYSSLLYDFILNQEARNRSVIIKDWYEFLEEETKKFRKRLSTIVPMADIDEFDFLKIFSKGKFGCVLLSFKDNNFYAVKIKKKCTVEDLQRADNEKRILCSLNCPFTVSLHYFFETDTSFFFVLTLADGKNLSALLNDEEYMGEDVAKFYVSQVLLALEYLHNFNIIYRDLKPENLIVDSAGFIKIVDFSVSKMVTDRTYTFCGTPEYMAPEIIEEKGYNISVDWWSFGVLTYELCSGFTPFFSRKVYNIFKNILNCEVYYPKRFSTELRDLIDDLLNKDVTKRLVTKYEHIFHLKSHEWFKNVNWENMANRVVRPPYCPECTHIDKFDTIAIQKLVL